MDDLKTINDSLGHMKGDWVLKAVGNMLSRSVRSIDVVGRIGRDESALVLLGMKASDSRELLSRLHEDILKMVWDEGLQIGISMGVVSFSVSI